MSHTFTIFNYICGELQWSGFGIDQAVVGYITSGEIYSNYPSSGLSSVADGVSCSFQINNEGRQRQIPYEIPVDLEEQLRIELCMNETERNSFLFLESEINPPDLAANLEPCPPTEGHARSDFGRFIKFSDDPLCYITGKPVRVPQIPQLSVTQQCCYTGERGYVVFPT